MDRVRMQADGLGLNPSVETETGGAACTAGGRMALVWSTWEEGMGRYCLEKSHGRGAKWMQDGTGRPAGLEETMAALVVTDKEADVAQPLDPPRGRGTGEDRGQRNGRDDMMGMCREAWDDGAGIWELDAGLVPGGDDGAGMRGDLLGAGMWGCRDDGAGMWGGSFQAGDLLAGRQWGKCGKLGWTGLKAKF
ncbi:hypothetical protein B0H14DRAFT_2654601 [Mycena olivaceomarginata]|nr:hypothetical protein B0H14DRAFT_2654601 [Mycena olivaceomarginata]